MPPSPRQAAPGQNMAQAVDSMGPSASTPLRLVLKKVGEVSGALPPHSSGHLQNRLVALNQETPS